MINTKTIRWPAVSYLLFFLTAFGMLFFRLGSVPFLGSDECRYARIAQEMNRAGNWVTPLLQGLPWLEKPPLYYWITMPLFKLLGVSEAAARLGPALCALTAGLVLVWLGTRLWSHLAGFLSGLILLTTIGFCAFGRSASPDMPFSAGFTVALALLAAACLRGGLGFWKIALAYTVLGLAVLAKGPVAVVLGAGIVLLFWVLDEQGGCLRRMHVWAGALITAAVGLPWFWLAFKENGYSFIAVFFINHNLARYVTDIHHHEQPFYYFALILPGLLFPWTGWLPALMPRFRSGQFLHWRAWDRDTVFLTCWALFPVLFFSLSDSKLPGYVLPSIPPLALLLGRRLADWIQKDDERGKLGGTCWFSFVLGLLVAAAFPIVLAKNYGNAWRAGLPLAMAVLVPSVAAFVFARLSKRRAAVSAVAALGLVLVLAITQFGFPLLATYDSTAGIARQALVEGAQGEPMVTFCFFDHTLLYYTGYRMGENFLDPPALLAFARKQPRFLVVTDADRAHDLAQIPGLSLTLLGEQGKIRLLRLTSSLR